MRTKLRVRAVEIAPGVTVEEVLDKTAAPVAVSASLRTIEVA